MEELDKSEVVRQLEELAEQVPLQVDMEGRLRLCDKEARELIASLTERVLELERKVDGKG